ncbi:MAG: polyisoprenoid-binding protein YceI, partial [Myxococcota bacterium]
EVTDGGTKLWPGHKVKATLKGKLTIKGVSKPVEAASTIGFYAHTPELDGFGIKGNVLRIKSDFTVKLSEYEMSAPVVGKKVAEIVGVSLNLTAIQE